MTGPQRLFLAYIRDHYFHTSTWLCADGKPPTGGLQKLTILELQGMGGTLRTETDELRAIGKCFAPGTTVAQAFVLTDAGRRALEGVG